MTIVLLPIGAATNQVVLDTHPTPVNYNWIDELYARGHKGVELPRNVDRGLIRAIFEDDDPLNGYTVMFVDRGDKVVCYVVPPSFDPNPTDPPALAERRETFRVLYKPKTKPVLMAA